MNYMELNFYSEVLINYESISLLFFNHNRIFYYVLVIYQMPRVSHFIFPTNISPCYINNHLKIKYFDLIFCYDFFQPTKTFFLNQFHHIKGLFRIILFCIINI